MHYTETHIQKLIDGVLPYLNKTPTMRKKVFKSGHELLAMGVYLTESGKPIVRGQQYPAFQDVPVEINHAKHLRKLIKNAKTEKAMTDAVGIYMAKHGHKPQQQS